MFEDIGFLSGYSSFIFLKILLGGFNREVMSIVDCMKEV
jgi:hypothetical protein